MEAIVELAILGIDLGKKTLHLHGQDKAGHPVLRRKVNWQQLLPVLIQMPRCVVVMEACAGADYLARKAIELGHDAMFIAPQYVKPIVKSN